MKFALFLICALVAVQGYNARSVDSVDEFQTYEAERSLKDLIEKIGKIINDIIKHIPDVINSIKDKINEVIGKINEFVKDLKQKVEDLIHLGAAGKRCVEQNRDKIEALIKDAQNGAQACVAEANKQTVALKDQLNQLVTKANDIRQDASDRLLKCVQDNQLHPIELIKCLANQVEPLKQEIAELEEEVSKTVKVSKETAQKVVATLSDCSSKLVDDLNNKKDELLNIIKKCVADSS